MSKHKLIINSSNKITLNTCTQNANVILVKESKSGSNSCKDKKSSNE